MGIFLRFIVLCTEEICQAPIKYSHYLYRKYQLCGVCFFTETCEFHPNSYCNNQLHFVQLLLWGIRDPPPPGRGVREGGWPLTK